MLNSPKPSTPVSQTTSSTPCTGTWRHPRLDEIVIRQNASNFDKQNIRRILYNIGGITAIFYVSRKIVEIFPLLFHESKTINQYSRYTYYIIQLTLTYNIIVAISPLLRQPDDLADVPLTPAQRKLLGLQPLSTAPLSDAKYKTPPKYPRTSSPLSGSPISRDRNSGIKFSANGSPTFSNSSSSPFTPGKIGKGSNQRPSFESNNLSTSYKGTYEMPSTPTPGASKGVGGLHNKWLYDKGRRNSGSSRVYV